MGVAVAQVQQKLECQQMLVKFASGKCNKTISSEDLELLHSQTDGETAIVGLKTHICNSSFRTVQKITHTDVLELKHHTMNEYGVMV
jgi:hypothetical protein